MTEKETSKNQITKEEFQKILRESDPILTSLLSARDNIQSAIENRIKEIARGFGRNINL